MPSRKRNIPQHGLGGSPGLAVGVHVLEQFSAATLARWTEVSQDLDELNAALFFGTQPEQRRLRPQLIGAIEKVEPISLDGPNWVRFITYQYSFNPLSAAGSLLAYGGRFNAGVDLDPGTLDAWPCLYLAEDDETAFREKFQAASTSLTNGLRPADLALARLESYTKVAVNVCLHRVFDMTSPEPLRGLAGVLGRIKMPPRAKYLKKKLKIPDGELKMVSTGQMLYDTVFSNWRTLPVQFGLPAPSHVIAELVRAAGYEAILYRSTKGGGRCVAVFPDLIDSGSFIELANSAPPEVQHTRLDARSADALAGWEEVLIRRRGSARSP